MDIFPLIAKGLAIGFSLAAPVGPMALLCIQRTLLQGVLFGLITGLGVAAADAVFGMTAAFGFTAVSDFLIEHKTIVRFVGGIFLGWLGLKAMLNASSPIRMAKAAERDNWLHSLSSAFILTLSNPMTILAYVAIFSSDTIAPELDDTAAALVITGAIFAGSMAWWILLTSIIGFTKKKMQPKHIQHLNFISGLIILAFGFFVIISAFR